MQQLKERILVVEDMPKNLQMIGAILRKEGYRVSMAINASDALISMKHEFPDLILSDIMLPGINGFEFCTKLKADPHYKNIPIIFLSGLTDKLNKIHGFSIGAADYITKPIEKDEMLARVRTHLKLHYLHKELETANTNLEKKIAERTHELKIAKEKAEESERVKTAFLASVSHELRTPLNSIIGFSELILDDINPQETIKFIKSINSSGKQLLEIIEGIFSIILLETGETTIINAEFNLEDFLLDINKQIEDAVDKKRKSGVDVVFKSPHIQQQITLTTDKFKLKQIFLILIKNAIKFTNEGSVEYGCSIIEDQLRFYVKDTGIGIPQVYHKKIFERFWQVEYKDNKLYGGLGVGLSIAHQLSILLNFKISFITEVDQGSTFYLDVADYDVSEKDDVKKSTYDIPSNLLKGKTILIAEDEHTNYLYLKTTLELQGAYVIDAIDGEQAVVKAREFNPDLILMDLRMPLMNGFEAIKIIRTFNPDVPIITQTAYSLPDVFDQSYVSKNIDHLEKPIERKKLIKLLRKYLTPLE